MGHFYHVESDPISELSDLEAYLVPLNTTVQLE